MVVEGCYQEWLCEELLVILIRFHDYTVDFLEAFHLLFELL